MSIVHQPEPNSRVIVDIKNLQGLKMQPSLDRILKRENGNISEQVSQSFFALLLDRHDSSCYNNQKHDYS